jgi:hypothetical protein
MSTKFIPNYLIRPVPGSDQVNLRIINPTDPNDYVSLLRDGVEGACYEVIEAYNSTIGDPNFFYEWDEAVAFYEKESDEDWDDDFDDPWDNEDGDEDDNEYYI